jgi:hypothetical protein
MKKKLFLVICVLLASIAVSFGQSRDKKPTSKKLSKSEAANLTPEQRLVHETDRKTKGGKKKMSTKQKARIQKRQARAAKNTRQP